MTPSPLSVLGLYLGEPTAIQQGKKTVQSGIHKQPVPELWLDATGVRGDHVRNRKYHGGPDQAVYLYTQPDAAAWAAQGLPADLGRSYWGENVRLDGLESASLRVGDRLHLGEALLEVTAPRLPCAVAAAYLQDVYAGPFVKDFYALGRPGVYARVLRPGRVRVGDGVQLEPTPHDFPTLGELMVMHKQKAAAIGETGLRRALLAPLSHRQREEIGEKLAGLTAEG